MCNQSSAYRRVVSVITMTSIVLMSQLAYTPMLAHASPYDVIDAVVVSSMQQPDADSRDSDSVPLVSWVSMGTAAPFSGTLLNSIAMADITTRLDQAEARCQREVDHQVDVTRVTMQRDIDIVTARAVAAEDKLDLERRISGEKIDLLHTELELTSARVPKRNWGPLWFTGGVVAGVLVILAGAYAVKGVNNT